MQHQWLMWSLWIKSCVIEFKLWHANRNQCSDPISSSYRTMNLINNYKISNLYNAFTIIRLNALTIFISNFWIIFKVTAQFSEKVNPQFPTQSKPLRVCWGWVYVRNSVVQAQVGLPLKNTSIMLVILLTLPSQHMSMTSKSNGISWSFQQRRLGF